MLAIATTRLIAMHINKGKSAAQCLKDRIDYAKNPKKTENGELISAYACSPETVDQEFVLSRKEYMAKTGRHHDNEVIAYQLRQSFAPGEVTPEEANRIGYETAMRFLKGKHAFIVATHTDKGHIHNHIELNAVDIDCEHKFRNFLGSGKALGRLSDQICMEHRLSIITEKKFNDVSYDKWQGRSVKPTLREQLCMTIDEALQKKPDGFDALMKLIEEAGWKIKRGKQMSFLPPNGKKYIRIDTLGETYSEESLRTVLNGERKHIPRKYRGYIGEVGLIIDIEAKLRSGKGAGYERWAQRFNTEAMAKTMVFIKNHKIENRADLEKRMREMTAKRNKLQARIVEADTRMNELISQRKVITDYRRTRDIYVQYHDSGWSKAFYNEHKEQIDIHIAAKHAYDSAHGQMPKLADISAEFEKLKTQKQADRADLKNLNGELREIMNVKSNIVELLGTDEDTHDMPGKDLANHSNNLKMKN